MTDWADKEAKDLQNAKEWQVAAALREARAKGIEEAAKRMEEWPHKESTWAAAEIRKLKEQKP